MLLEKLLKTTMNKIMKKERWRGLIVAGAILLIGLGYEGFKCYMRSLPQAYTIGIVIDIWQPARGGPVIEYEYFVLGKKNFGSGGFYGYEDVTKIGHRFLVEYPKGHPGKGVLLLDRPVPDSVVAPEGGWNEMPDFARSE